jgi:RNA polymerase sigma-70 factor (ECF subfamily)
MQMATSTLLPDCTPMGAANKPVGQLIQCQDRLFAYVLALVGDPVAAEDVLQETNLAAAERLADAEHIADFTAWVFGVARNQVHTWRRRQGRERLRFGDELLDHMAEELPAATADLSARQQALRGCLADLPAEQRELILRRYAPGTTVQRLAAELNRTAAVVSQTLYRVRQVLAQCIQGKLAAEAAE